MRNNNGQRNQSLESNIPVLLASSNPAKVEKLLMALDGVSRLIRTPADLGVSIVIEETGITHKEIAETKGYLLNGKEIQGRPGKEKGIAKKKRVL